MKEAKCHKKNEQCLVTGNGKTRERTDSEMPCRSILHGGWEETVVCPTRHLLCFFRIVRPARKKQLKHITQV